MFGRVFSPQLIKLFSQNLFSEETWHKYSMAKLSHKLLSPFMPLQHNLPLSDDASKVCTPGDGSTSNEVMDEKLRKNFSSLTQKDADYWKFLGRAKREHSHGDFQYPAMMVPQMQAELIKILAEVRPDTKLIFDPFMGSGTVLGEAMAQGMGFGGCDINPLAVLLCHTKKGPFHQDASKTKQEQFISRLDRDVSSVIEVEFFNRDKWFEHYVAIDLSKIRRCIIAEPDLWFRRILWVVLAETVRCTSNSRTSTFKLHIRSKAEIETRSLQPRQLFLNTLERNLKSMLQQRARLFSKHLLKDDDYTQPIHIVHGDTREVLFIEERSNKLIEHDLLITSPPYGDNTTTVPYGQHSYLPLQWIAISDIDTNFSDEWLKTTQEIDRRSLGGSRRVEITTVQNLKSKSSTYIGVVEAYKDHKKDCLQRVTSFCHDLDSCIDPILRHLKSNSYMIWTVGNRMVGGLRVPFDTILTELLEQRGVVAVDHIKRSIPTKRQAERNSFAETMSKETILVLRKN